MDHFVVKEGRIRSSRCRWIVVVKRSVYGQNEIGVGFISYLQIHLVARCELTPVPGVGYRKTPQPYLDIKFELVKR